MLPPDLMLLIIAVMAKRSEFGIHITQQDIDEVSYGQVLQCSSPEQNAITLTYKDCAING